MVGLEVSTLIGVFDQAMSKQKIQTFDLNQQDCLDFANPFFSHFYQTGLQGLYQLAFREVILVRYLT
ncbi:MAG: hypothetical protein Kow0049_30090 [Stanieria sp.]